jgi:hypothetical protein
MTVTQLLKEKRTKATQLKKIHNLPKKNKAL